MRAVSAALLLASALIVSGCASSAGGPAVRFWGLGREGEVAGDLVREFERRNPGIRVEVQQIPFTAGHEKLLTAFVGRATPDVAQVGNTWVPEFAALGAIEDLTDRARASKSVVEADVFPGIWATNVVDGRLWGVPWYVDTRVMFYRADLVAKAGWKEPPRTWSEWRKAGRAILALRGPARYAFLFPTDEWAAPVILGIQHGARLLNDRGLHGAFREPAFRKGLEEYVAFFREGLAPEANNAQIGNLYQQFAEGYFAFYLTGPWNLGEFRRRLPAAIVADWRVAPMPAPDDGGEGVSLAGGSSLVVFGRAAARDAAWKLVEFLSEPEQQRRMYALSGDLPSRISAWDDPALSGDPRALAFRDQLGRVVPAPRIPEWEQIVQKVAEHAERAVRGRATVDEALEALDADVDRILEKRRSLVERRAREKP